MSPTDTHGCLISAESLCKRYQRGREEVRALENVTFQVRRGEFVAIVGASGSGKTTLLNLVGCMDTPTSGTIRLNGREIHHLTESERTLLRREEIGFVFQHFGLLPTLSVAENIALPLLFSGKRSTPPIDELLGRVRLSHRRNHRPNELSGGEMQRVAIARALIHKPSLLLADEPTGNLDSATGESIMSLFRDLNAGGLTILIVTHNPAIAAAADRRISMQDGRIVASA